jgi:hypothetical protein
MNQYATIAMTGDVVVGGDVNERAGWREQDEQSTYLWGLNDQAEKALPGQRVYACAGNKIYAESKIVEVHRDALEVKPFTRLGICGRYPQSLESGELRHIDQGGPIEAHDEHISTDVGIDVEGSR